MLCPKCQSKMEEVVYGKARHSICIDRCLQCKGIWFDCGESEAMQKTWLAESVDTGAKEMGHLFNSRSRINCPRCQKPMKLNTTEHVTGIWYEYCPAHGLYFDAGEFSESHHETLMSQFKAYAENRT